MLIIHSLCCKSSWLQKAEMFSCIFPQPSSPQIMTEELQYYNPTCVSILSLSASSAALCSVNYG